MVISKVTTPTLMQSKKKKIDAFPTPERSYILCSPSLQKLNSRDQTIVLQYLCQKKEVFIGLNP